MTPKFFFISDTWSKSLEVGVLLLQWINDVPVWQMDSFGSIFNHNFHLPWNLNFKVRSRLPWNSKFKVRLPLNSNFKVRLPRSTVMWSFAPLSVYHNWFLWVRWYCIFFLVCWFILSLIYIYLIMVFSCFSCSLFSSIFAKYISKNFLFESNEFSFSFPCILPR